MPLFPAHEPDFHSGELLAGVDEARELGEGEATVSGTVSVPVSLLHHFADLTDGGLLAGRCGNAGGEGRGGEEAGLRMEERRRGKKRREEKGTERNEGNSNGKIQMGR